MVPEIMVPTHYWSILSLIFFENRSERGFLSFPIDYGILNMILRDGLRTITTDSSELIMMFYFVCFVHVPLTGIFIWFRLLSPVMIEP